MSTLSSTSSEVKSGSSDIQDGMAIIRNTTDMVDNISEEILTAFREMNEGLDQIKQYHQ
jgi:hypothetical protein